MKADLSRVTFDRAKRFSGVRMQQGRVQLDRDWNEHADILAYLERTEAMDVVGPCGVPKDGGGFAVSVSGADVTLSPGRMYVGGLLCELDAETSYATQPDLPSPPAVSTPPSTGRVDLVYLDVWERHVSALEDPSLLEEALGGPDTTTRRRVVWQVRVEEGVAATTCADVAGWTPAEPDGRLTTDVDEEPPAEDPCLVEGGGGYRGVENRLYRVEIHEGSEAGAPTFKWSRDNGSVAFAIEELVGPQPTNRIRVHRTGRDAVLALRPQDWIEVVDDAAELEGRPGTLVQVTAVDEHERILTLDGTVSGIDPAAHAKAIRWDGGDAVALASGRHELEHGIVVDFSGSTFRSGDHWVFAARTATGGLDRLTDAPPLGIRHHYCPLALVRWTPGGSTPAHVEDCRPLFPPLTAITAEDVSYDDASCVLGADTVQEALDRLCTEVDLPFHNKHLHGWGIVCGLEVHCHPSREQVIVRRGYAIDCEGRDHVLDREDVPLLELARDAGLIDEKGDGDVSLLIATAGANANGNGSSGGNFALEAYDPAWKSRQEILRGTLLMDFYRDCIETIVEFVRNEFTPDPGEEEQLVGPTARRITTFGNLLVQLVNPQTGRNVFLSRKEHEILLKFYTDLRERLQSHTFCAMFDDARQFPEYPSGFPFSAPAATTIFGKGFHTRLRLHPSRPLAYTAGGGRSIHVYDLDAEEMVAAVEFPVGAGSVVQDVAVSATGEQLFAVALVKDADTIFGVSRLDADGRPTSWDTSVLCDINLVTLAVSSKVKNRVFAAGRGSGLYALEPGNVPESPTPIHAFNASGHLVLDDAEGRAYAAANAPGAGPERYDRFLRLGLTAGSQAESFALRDPGRNQNNEGDVKGDDDIAVGGAKVWVVAEPSGASGKRLLAYDMDAIPPDVPAVEDGLDDSDLRLAFNPLTKQVMVSSEDGYRLDLVDAKATKLADTYLYPLQVSPIALAVPPKPRFVYALNYASNTITAAPANQIDPKTDPQIGELGEYRDAVLDAFTDLFAGFLQYLKDCFCDHLLVRCPEGDEDDKLYLAAISVRGNRVYQVCNFSRRKYVKSFPTMGYWLSIVPIIPFLDRAIATFCCAVLPQYFSRVSASPEEEPETVRAEGRSNRVRSKRLRTGVSKSQTTDFRALIGRWLSGIRLSSPIALDALGTSVSRTLAGARTDGVGRTEVVGQPTTEAANRLESSGVVVETVEPYDKERLANVVEFAKAPIRLAPGTHVKLYEQEGEVRYYAVVPEAAPATAEAPAAATVEEVASLREELKTRDEELASLRTEIGRLAKVRTQVADLETKVNRLTEKG